MGYSFFETVAGDRTLKIFAHNFPKIANNLDVISSKRRPHGKQIAEIVEKSRLKSYLNEEFEKGHIFVNATPLKQHSDYNYLVVTEE